MRLGTHAAVVAAAALVVAACEEGGGPRSPDLPVTVAPLTSFTTAPVTTVALDPDPAARKAKAAAVVLKAPDVPGWRAERARRGSTDQDDVDPCLQGAAAAASFGAADEVEGERFGRGEPDVREQVSSVATVMAVDKGQLLLEELVRPAVLQCLDAAAEREIGGGLAFDVTGGPTAFPGVDQAVVVNVQVVATGAGFAFGGRASITVVRKGTTVGGVFYTGGINRFDLSERDRLVRVLVSRL